MEVVSTIFTGTLVAGAIVALFYSRRAKYGTVPRISQTAIQSPRATLTPYITAEQDAKLSYPSNLLPGSRDVRTPFGVMRVNEWGPENGRKVVFVHGDATPSPLWSRIADRLTKAGCRVMTFDLWGRGYTDTPLNCPHESQFFALQILFAINSSSISWTAHGGFSLVGFSLGGPIALDYAGTFPNTVNSIALLGPAGLIRTKIPGYDSFWFKHPWLVPTESILRNAVADILEVKKHNMDVIRPSRLVEGKSHHSQAFTNWSPSTVDTAGLLQWQFDYHRGHVKSFYETATYGPVRGQEAIWSRACEIISSKRCKGNHLSDTKVIVFLGKDDGVVKPDETRVDILKYLPSERVHFVTLPGGHGFPYPNSDRIADELAKFWGLQ